MISNAEFLSKMAAFYSHWTSVNARIAPDALVIQLPVEKTTMTRAQFDVLKTAVKDRQDDVQDLLQDEVIARGVINLQKEALLAKFHLFAAKLDAFYQPTEYYAARPLAPNLKAGQKAFTKPMTDTMKLWGKINAASPPPGVTLPLLLADGTTKDAFASQVSTLQFAYDEWEDASQDTSIMRGSRDMKQDTAYEAMKSYRAAVESDLAMHPDLVASLPRLTPLPGHTPERVNASAVFEAPNHSKVVHDPSDDPLLERFELRGTAGEEYDPNDAVVIASHGPNDPREFITDFGLGQPGAQVALKLFVILSTGNQSGSATMVVKRPLAAVA